MSSNKLPQLKVDSVLSLFSSGQFGDALESIALLTKEYPKDELLFNIKGACYAGLGQFDDAIKSYERALLINPKYAKAYFNLGGALHELGQLDDATINYKKSLDINPSFAEAQNNLGNVYKELGQLDKAIDSYQKALAINPKYAEAHFSIAITFQLLDEFEKMIEHLEVLITIQPNFFEAYNYLGIALKETGQFKRSVKAYEKALKIKPESVEVHNNIGNAFNALGQINESVKSYKKAISINSEYPTLQNNLGNALKTLGKLDEAVNAYQKALILNPENPETHNNLGAVLFEMGKSNDAISSYESALKINPNYAEASNNLGASLIQIGRIDEAVKSYKKALKINPTFSDAFNNLGIAQKKLVLFDEAIKSYRSAIKINNNDADTYNNIGIVYTESGQFDNALNAYETALSIDSSNADVHNNLAILLVKLKRINDAYKSNELALNIKPNFAEGYAIRGQIFTEMSQLDKALESLNKAREINPDLAYILGTVLSTKMNMCYWDQVSSELLELEKRINNNEKVIVPFDLLSLIDDPELQGKTSAIYSNDQYPKSHSLPRLSLYSMHSKIRVGYFSADFRMHPVATLTAELYELHDREQFEIHAFSFGPDTNDEMNLRIKAGVDHFHDVREMSHKELAMFSRSLEIDIAVDLGGYTADCRTEVFAMSAAPIQLCYIGVLSTMGTDYYDYLIVGKNMIPQKNQKYYAEKIVYLPSYQVNDSTESPPEANLTRKDLSLPEKGFVFCCFNNTYKITPTVFDSWARILKSVEHSVIMIYVSNKLAQENLTKEIILRGIDPKRLIFGQKLSRPMYLARYRAADLFLDTHPYNAGTTASDALRMGLPILTLNGNSFNSREAASILNSVNLPELITETEEEYESLAIELATNPIKLKSIKDRLTDNLSTAPLFDTPLFTKNLESAYKIMYERQHKGIEPDHIYLEQ